MTTCQRILNDVLKPAKNYDDVTILCLLHRGLQGNREAVICGMHDDPDVQQKCSEKCSSNLPY